MTSQPFKIQELRIPKRYPHQIKFMQWPPPARGTALVTGFGGGKTFAHGLKAVINSLYMPNIEHTCVSPTFPQARRTIIPAIFDTLEKHFNLKEGKHFRYNKSEHFFNINLWNGKIYVCSGDKPSSLKGQNVGSFGMDEPGEQKEDVYKQMLARLRDPRAGNFLHYYLTGTPEGLNWLYDLCEPDGVDLKENHCLTCAYYNKTTYKCGQENKFHIKYDSEVSKGDICENYLKKLVVVRGKTTDNESLPQSYINDLLDKYSEKEVKAYVNGEFINLSDGTAYDFDRDLHVRKTKIDPSRSLLVGMDFNYKVMTASIWQTFEENGIKKIKCVDEIWLENCSGTTQLCNELIDRYGDHPTGMIIYPDPACDNRASHNASNDVGNTDRILMENAFFNRGISKTKYRIKTLSKKENSRIDSLKSVNAMFKNGLGYIKVAIDPKCKHLIEDFQKITKSDFIEKQIEKKNPLLGHISDGVRYFVHKEFKPPRLKYYEKINVNRRAA